MFCFGLVFKLELYYVIYRKAASLFFFSSVSRDFLTAEDKENIFNADHFPLWFRRAAEQIPGSFVYSIPFSPGL